MTSNSRPAMSYKNLHKGTISHSSSENSVQSSKLNMACKVSLYTSRGHLDLKTFNKVVKVSKVDLRLYNKPLRTGMLRSIEFKLEVSISCSGSQGPTYLMFGTSLLPIAKCRSLPLSTSRIIVLPRPHFLSFCSSRVFQTTNINWGITCGPIASRASKAFSLKSPSSSSSEISSAKSFTAFFSKAIA